MKNKKIFFLANAKSIHTVKWVDYFVEQNYDVYLATFASVNNTKCKNIYFLSKKNINVMGGNYHYLWSVLKLSKIFFAIKPDIINAHFSYSMGLIGLLAKNRAKIQTQFSVVCHGTDILNPPHAYIFDKINKYVLHNSDKIVVVSNQIKDKVENFRIDINKIFIGQYGLSIEEKPLKKDVDILSNRAYTPNSRIDFLLECLDEFKDRGLNIVFIIPNISDNDFTKIVQKYTHIKFYKHVEYNKMLELIGRTKIYISATQSDGTALSLLEAMKLECIPLISNIVSNRSWVLDGINGYLFDGKIEFRRKLKNILNLEINIQKNMVKNNKELLLDKGDYKSQMKKIEDFLI